MSTVLAYAARASRAIAAQPHEGIERARERLAEWRDSRQTPWPYAAEEGCEEKVHELIAARWPCGEHLRFEEIWNSTRDELTARGLQAGRGAFGGWDDGDHRLGRVLWCLARHLRPERVVETGVARGLLTRVLLEALELNGAGHLWSIDLPPLLERGLALQTGAAVPNHLHERWTLLRGSSRTLLPGLVSDLGRLDLFVHDSMHTTRNLRFELGQAWPVLAPGAVAVIDDVERNLATGQFLQRHPDIPAVIGAAGDGRALIGCLVKR